MNEELRITNYGLRMILQFFNNIKSCRDYTPVEIRENVKI
jgi:hypothetical protein